MIDMVFILLIFFIVTTVFVDEWGLGVETPQPTSEPTMDDSETVVLRLLANGRVSHRGNVVSVEAVRGIVEAAKAASKVVSVVVEVEKTAVAGGMVHVIDAVREAAVERVCVRAVS